MINKLRKYCCDKLMNVNGVYDVDKKSHGILYRCLCCGSYEEIKTEENEHRKNNLIHKVEFL